MMSVDARALGREIRASYAFVERNWNLVKRYWGWEIAFFFYRLTSSLAVAAKLAKFSRNIAASFFACAS